MPTLGMGPLADAVLDEVAGVQSSPNDGIVPLSSALPQGSGLPNETQLPPFSDSHTQLECDSDVQNAVGAQLALQFSPTTLNFTVPSDGANPPGQTIQLNNQKTVNWVAAVADPAPAWLTIDPTSSTNPGTITVSVDTASLDTIPTSAAINLTAVYPSGRLVPASIPINAISNSIRAAGLQ